MDSNSKRHKACIEDRISGMPDEILCYILSFLSSIREAMKTSVLSRRWKNLWAEVPNINLDETEFKPEGDEFDPDSFKNFVDRVVVFGGSSNINSLRLIHRRFEDQDVSRVDAWICAAVRRNVVQLNLSVSTSSLRYELPRSLFMCNTLEFLRLWLHSYIVITTTPTSNCFSCLKFLAVRVSYPDVSSLEKLLSSCPLLEGLSISGYLRREPTLCLHLSAPKLKILKIRLYVLPLRLEDEDTHFINVDAPNLEEFDLEDHFSVSCSLTNAKSLSNVKIDHLDIRDPKSSLSSVYHVPHAYRLCWLLEGVSSATNLSIATQILGHLDSEHQCLLPAFNNVNRMELCHPTCNTNTKSLPTCGWWQSLTHLIKISPNLEHLVFENNTKCSYQADEIEHEWSPPEFVPVCLLSHLKTICMRGFKGRPNEMEVVKYLVEHGRVLKKVTICADFLRKDEMMLKFSSFRRGSKTCEIEFQTITWRILSL